MSETNIWKYWQDELSAIADGFAPSLDAPAAQDRDIGDGEPIGFWRVRGARTKNDWPVLVYREEGQIALLMQWGGARPKAVEKDSDTYHEFIGMTFLKCSAVGRDEWMNAVKSGRWPDGKAAYPETVEKKLDIIPTTPPAEGGNMPEGEDRFHQLQEKIASLAEKAKGVGTVITTLEQANAAAEVLEPMRGLWKLADAQRKVEKKPHDDAAAAVQAKWADMLQTAAHWGKTLLDAIEAFKATEKKRLEREEADRQRAERERLAEENRKRIAAEAEAAAREATAKGEDKPAAPTEEEIAAQAEQEAAAQIAAAPAPEITAPRVGTAYGKAVSKATTRKGRIIDVRALCEHFIHSGDDDFIDYLQKRADAAARAKITLPGMEIL